MEPDSGDSFVARFEMSDTPGEAFAGGFRGSGRSWGTGALNVLSLRGRTRVCWCPTPAKVATLQ